MNGKSSEIFVEITLWKWTNFLNKLKLFHITEFDCPNLAITVPLFEPFNNLDMAIDRNEEEEDCGEAKRMKKLNFM